MSSKLFYSQLLGAVLLFLVVIIVVPLYTQRIPEELRFRVQKKLVMNGIDWASIRVNGRDITLSGVAPTIEEHLGAIKLVKSVSGIRTVYDKISPIVITPYSMMMEYNGKELTLKGYMPSQTAKAELLQKLKNLYPNVLVDGIDIGTGEPSNWSDFILLVATQLKKFEVASVTIIDETLHISGKIPSVTEKKFVENKLVIFQKVGYVLHSHIVSLDEPIQVCQEKFDALLERKKIEFESGKSILKPQSEPLLQELSDIALLCPEAKLEVIGHTDNQGNHQKNLELSLTRAKAIVAKLFGFGVSLDRLEAKGAGESAPIAQNTTPEGRAKNRRIEFKVIGN